MQEETLILFLILF